MRFGLVLILIAMLLAWCHRSVEHAGATGLTRLAEALGPSRLIEARLSVFDHAPCVAYGPRGARCSEPPPYGTPAFERLAEVAPWLRQASLSTEEGGGHHALGLWSLVWANDPDELSEAIRILEQASRSPRAARKRRSELQFELWNDLAAVYLARAQAADDPLDLLHALEWIECSLAERPEGLAARFNRALTLEKLFLIGRAKAAWKQYLERDSDSGWAREAEAYLAKLESSRRTWEQMRPALIEALKTHSSDVCQLLDEFRTPARRWAENELLALWAEGDSGAVEALSKARRVGHSLVDLGGGELLDDSVDAIDSAIERHDFDALQRLKAGHRAYARAVELTDRRNCGAARAPIAEAIERLTPVSPFAFLARLVELRCAHQTGEHQRAATLGQELVGDLESLGQYPEVLGRCHWLIASSMQALGQLGPSERAYRRAVEHLLSVGDWQSAAEVRGLVAGVYDDVGDPR